LFAGRCAADGTIYIKDTGNYLYAINPDGTLKWRVIVTGLSYAAPRHRARRHPLHRV